MAIIRKIVSWLTGAFLSGGTWDCFGFRRKKITSQTVDARSDAGGAEAIVDIHYRHIRGAGIQHSEQRSYTTEACAVAGAGGHGDDWNTDKTADYAWQSAFHSGHADDDPGFG